MWGAGGRRLWASEPWGKESPKSRARAVLALPPAPTPHHSTSGRLVFGHQYLVGISCDFCGGDSDSPRSHRLASGRPRSPQVPNFPQPHLLSHTHQSSLPTPTPTHSLLAS